MNVYISVMACLLPFVVEEVEVRGVEEGRGGHKYFGVC